MSFLSPTLRLENLSTQPIMSLDHVPEAQRYNKQHIVAQWCAPINGKMYRIELEHGTTSGRRMIWVNGREVLRRDWMFKLVGEDTFLIESSRCIIRVDPAPGFKYEYSLYIDGKPHAQYTEELTRQYRLWLITSETGQEYRIMLKLDTLSLYVNDELREEAVNPKKQLTGNGIFCNNPLSAPFWQAVFVQGGTDTHFVLDQIQFVLQARSSGNKHDGIVHTLLADGSLVPEAKIQEIMQEPVSILQTN
ncbi:fas apoptotic inhibitory molecule 1 isoform X1 [Scaptodrosophila lebanonensis]|uniref:Fas apoptotic inhibitory molecule 1 isoform X1 n=1 Tax=Drosophila lebanonensis TaxID=7225 RepID=A0A6J2UHS6_DROLE|nr:fas apoptotic inhibitory molecule 1 isoform X1 [Scaptodrosophila lebanonensis]